MNDRFHRVLISFLVIWVFVISIQIGLTVADHRTSEAMKSALGPTAAAWAQAVGTVFAFIIAFRLATDENDRERARRFEILGENRVRARFIARQLAQIADARMDAAARAFDGDPLKNTAAGWALTQRTVEADLATMKTFNLHDLEEIKPMQTFALLIGLMRSTCDILQPLALGALDRKSTFKPYVAKAKQEVGELHAQVSRLTVLLHEQLAELDAAVPPKAKAKRRGWVFSRRAATRV